MQSAVPARRPERPVTLRRLDAVLDNIDDVLDAELVQELVLAEPLVFEDPIDVEAIAHRSPLDPDRPGGAYPTALRGGVVTDPEEIAAIRRRVEAGVRAEARRGAWRRVLRRIRNGR